MGDLFPADVERYVDVDWFGWSWAAIFAHGYDVIECSKSMKAIKSAEAIDLYFILSKGYIV